MERAREDTTGYPSEGECPPLRSIGITVDASMPISMQLAAAVDQLVRRMAFPMHMTATEVKSTLHFCAASVERDEAHRNDSSGFARTPYMLWDAKKA